LTPDSSKDTHHWGGIDVPANLFNSSPGKISIGYKEDFHSKAIGTDREHAVNAERKYHANSRMAQRLVFHKAAIKSPNLLECNRSTSKGKTKCSGCSVASPLRSSKKWVKAWRSGHKRASQHLKEKHETWKDSFTAVTRSYRWTQPVPTSWDYKPLALFNTNQLKPCEHELVGEAATKVFTRIWAERIWASLGSIQIHRVFELESRETKWKDDRR
jgi:hypothetical protein